MKYGKRVRSDSSKGTGLPYTTQNNGEDHEVTQVTHTAFIKTKARFFP